MLRPTATNVTAMENYTLHITFDNGEQKLFDVKPYIKGNWYKELQDHAYFNSVNVDGYTVAWPHGQDLCPDDLYYLSKAI